MGECTARCPAARLHVAPMIPPCLCNWIRYLVLHRELES